jgi:hypothetical protein
MSAARGLDELPVVPELVVIAAAGDDLLAMPPRRRRARRKRYSCCRWGLRTTGMDQPSQKLAVGDRAGLGVADGRPGSLGTLTATDVSLNATFRGVSVERGVWRSARTRLGSDWGWADMRQPDGLGCRSVSWGPRRRLDQRSPEWCSDDERTAAVMLYMESLAIRNGSCESPSAWHAEARPRGQGGGVEDAHRGTHPNRCGVAWRCPV